MRKLKTLKNILLYSQARSDFYFSLRKYFLANLLATTVGISFGINKGYSQEKEYYVGDPTYSEEGIKKVDEETFWKIAKENNHYRSGMEDELNKSPLTKWYVIPGEDKNGGFRSSGSAPKTTQSYKAGSYQATPTKQVEFKSNNSQTIQNSNTQNKITPGRNINYSTPSNSNKNSDLEDLGKAVIIGGAVIGGIYLLNELFKPRKPKYVYTEPPKVNPPANVNAEKNYISEKQWWEETKEPKKENKNWWEEKTDKLSKELSDLVKEQNKYSPETKKKLEEEAKIADEYFKERGMNPEGQVRYKIVGTAEIGPNGELIKKDSYSPEREMTDEEKVILYHTYQAMKKHPVTGLVMEDVETVNEFGKKGFWDEKYEESGKIFAQPEKNGAPDNSFYYGTTKFQKDAKTLLYVAGEKLASPIVGGIEKSIDAEKNIRGENVKNWLNQQIKEEKEVDFLFSKPLGDNTYHYFKLAGKEELYKSYNESSKIASYVIIKNSPWGDEIINVAKDFKEKVEKTKNFWED